MFFYDRGMDFLTSDVDRVRRATVKLCTVLQPSDQVSWDEAHTIKDLGFRIREITIADIWAMNFDPIIFARPDFHTIHWGAHKSRRSIQFSFSIKRDSTAFRRTVKAVNSEPIASMKLPNRFCRKRSSS